MNTDWVMSLCRIQAAPLLLLLTSSCGAPPVPGEVEPAAVPEAIVDAPAIVVLDIDTLRADRLGIYGNRRATSPNIDSVARRGVYFERAFSQAPHTPPSQSSILSSLYPSSHGVHSRQNRLPDEVTTLAEALRDQGFATGGFVDGGYLSRGFGLEQGFETYDDAGGGLSEIGPKALEWIRLHADGPFFVLIHTYDVHTPYDPLEPFRSLFLDDVPSPTPGFEPTSERMEQIRLSQWTDDPQALPPNDLAYALALYDAGIRYVDDWTGKLLAELRALGLERRLILVVLSDHGEEFQEHGSVLHEKLYATVTRIPLIFLAPGLEAGLRIHRIVESIDVMPTLLELAGAPLPPEIQGESLVPLLRGHDATDGIAFSESPFFGRQRAIAVNRFHLLTSVKRSGIELYDLRRDPLEQHDRSATDRRSLTQVKAILRTRAREIEDQPPPARRASTIGKDVVRRLRELGYLH